jgi:hypothetical protein
MMTAGVVVGPQGAPAVPPLLVIAGPDGEPDPRPICIDCERCLSPVETVCPFCGRSQPTTTFPRSNGT